MASLALVGLLLAAAPAHATIVAQHANFLTVTESIAASGANWEYSYTFTNTDPSDIWHFLVYTSFSADVTSASFPANAGSSVHLDDGFPEYDARNVEPSLTHFTNMWYEPFATPDSALTVGSGASFSFLSSVHDASPKLFAYETSASGWAVDTGSVAAYGYTTTFVPEPGTLSLLGLGVLGLLRARRRSRC